MTRPGLRRPSNRASITLHASAEHWISFRRESPEARLRLFCLPYAGGGASAYRRWQSLLPPTVEVCPVQPPGRENRIREPPLTNTGTLIDALDAALRPMLDRPFALFGYSMGATIAFEWAHHLRQACGVEPGILMVAARAAPQVPRTWPAMYQLPDAELKDRLQELEGTPPEVLDNEELMDLLLPLLRADFEMHDTYQPAEREPLACPVFAYGALEDGDVPEEHIRAWEEVTTGEFRIHLLPGDHFSLLRDDRLPRHVGGVLEALLE